MRGRVDTKRQRKSEKTGKDRNVKTEKREWNESGRENDNSS